MKKSCSKSNSKKAVKKVKGMGHYPTIDKEEVDFRVAYAHENGTIAEVWECECDLRFYEDYQTTYYQTCTLNTYVEKLKKLGCKVKKVGDYIHLYAPKTKYEWVLRVPRYGIVPKNRKNILYGNEWVPVKNYLHFSCEELNSAVEVNDDDTPAEILADVKKSEKFAIKYRKEENKKTKKVA